MKSLIFSFLFSIQLLNSQAQQSRFPQSWIGNWKGELHWARAGNDTVQKINMELQIHPVENGKYSWKIIYGSANTDNRPYELYAKDSSKGHWVIDEKNGIVLDQFLINGNITGSFSVQQTIITNKYRLEENRLIVEFFSMRSTPLTKTGMGTEESPEVSSYKMTGFQQAVLQRVN